MYAAALFSIANLMADMVVTLLSSQYYFLTGFLGGLLMSINTLIKKGTKLMCTLVTPFIHQ